MEHRDEHAQAALALVRARSALVGARTKLINHARGAAKSQGHRLPGSSAAAFPKRLVELPAELRRSLEPVGACIAHLTPEIHAYDQRITQVSAEEYPATELLRQVPGVGPLTALVFVLVVQHPADSHAAATSAPTWDLSHARTRAAGVTGNFESRSAGTG